MPSSCRAVSARRTLPAPGQGCVSVDTTNSCSGLCRLRAQHPRAERCRGDTPLSLSLSSSPPHSQVSAPAAPPLCGHRVFQHRSPGRGPSGRTEAPGVRAAGTARPRWRCLSAAFGCRAQSAASLRMPRAVPTSCPGWQRCRALRSLSQEQRARVSSAPPPRWFPSTGELSPPPSPPSPSEPE